MSPMIERCVKETNTQSLVQVFVGDMDAGENRLHLDKMHFRGVCFGRSS